MNFVPRLRQACSGIQRRSTVGELWVPNFDEETNVAILTGVILHDPTREKSREGEAITVFQIAFPAPDERARRAAACCDVEVPDELARTYRRQLQPGQRVMVFGRLTGPGGLWATAIVIA